MKKKLIAALLTTAMLFTGLTGCGGSSEGGAQTGKTDSAATEETGESAGGETAAAAEPGDNFNETGYPIVNEPITLAPALTITLSQRVGWRFPVSFPVPPSVTP